jgi:hypothetical protein
MTHEAIGHLDAMKKALEALEPLDQDARKRALKWLAETLEVDDLEGPAGQSSDGSPSPGTDQRGVNSRMTPKQFMSAKQPTTDIERITCLAYYATHSQGTPHFKTAELTGLNTEAALPKFGNSSQAADNALKNGYLAQAGKGNRQITVRGEAVVSALPDREAVSAALAAHPSPARRVKRAPRIKPAKAK